MYSIFERFRSKYCLRGGGGWFFGGGEMGCFGLKCNAHHQLKLSADVEDDDWDDLLGCLVGKWADPGGTAMPGQPATRPEQAPEPHPLAKISLISKGAHGPRIRY